MGFSHLKLPLETRKRLMGTTSKALSLLDIFSRTTPLIGLSDLSRRAGLNKATTYRLLNELAAHGMVEQVAPGREYRLGPAFLRLAALREHHVPIREIAASILGNLARATGETAHMSLLQGEVLSTIAYAYGPGHGTLVRMEDAEVLSIHATSSGLALLAFSPPEFVDAVLSKPLAARTPKTITDPTAIRALLPGIRKAGFAISVGGFEADVHSHAMPVFNASAACIGVVAVAAPVSRMNDALAAVIRSELAAHVTHMTRLLGGFPPSTFPTFSL